MMDKEEIKRREWLKQASFKEKMKYYSSYYTIPLIITLFFAAVGISFVRTFIIHKESALYVTLVNFAALKEDSAAIADPFAKEHINTRRQEIVIDNSSYISADESEVNVLKYGYEDEQRLMTFVFTGLIDIMISGDDVIERYAEKQWFDDLSTFMDADMLAEFEKEGRILKYGGVPIAVRTDDSALLNDNYYYNGRKTDGLYAAFTANSEHRELAVEFLQYLLDGK